MTTRPEQSAAILSPETAPADMARPHTAPPEVARSAPAPACPGAAEIARTVFAGHLAAVIRVPWSAHAEPVLHTPDDDGTPLLLIGEDHVVARATLLVDQVPAVLAVSDMHPMPGPDRIRLRAELGGRLSPVRPLDMGDALERIAAAHQLPIRDLIADPEPWVLRLEPTDIRLQRPGGPVMHVDPLAYADADPDPLAEREDIHLRHLARHHADLVALLWERAGGNAGAGAGAGNAGTAARVVPKALDRFGMTLTADGRCVRLAFPQPLRCWHSVGPMLRAMTRSPRRPA